MTTEEQAVIDRCLALDAVFFNTDPVTVANATADLSIAITALKVTRAVPPPPPPPPPDPNPWWWFWG